MRPPERGHPEALFPEPCGPNSLSSRLGNTPSGGCLASQCGHFSVSLGNGPPPAHSTAKPPDHRSKTLLKSQDSRKDTGPESASHGLLYKTWFTVLPLRQPLPQWDCLRLLTERSVRDSSAALPPFRIPTDSGGEGSIPSGNNSSSEFTQPANIADLTDFEPTQ